VTIGTIIGVITRILIRKVFSQDPELMGEVPGPGIPTIHNKLQLGMEVRLALHKLRHTPAAIKAMLIWLTRFTWYLFLTSDWSDDPCLSVVLVTCDWLAPLALFISLVVLALGIRVDNILGPTRQSLVTSSNADCSRHGPMICWATFTTAEIQLSLGGRLQVLVSFANVAMSCTSSTVCSSTVAAAALDICMRCTNHLDQLKPGTISADGCTIVLVVTPSQKVRAGSQINKEVCEL
jgi:hypothetical protein